jgi:hypothetical protein
MSPDQLLFAEIAKTRAAFIASLRAALDAGLELWIDLEREDEKPPKFPFQVHRRILLPSNPAESGPSDLAAQPTTSAAPPDTPNPKKGG